MKQTRTVQLVRSNVVSQQVFSEEVPDYRTLDEILRITEENKVRETENDLPRLIE